MVNNMLDLWKLHPTLCTLNHPYLAPYIPHILYNMSYVPHLEPLTSGTLHPHPVPFTPYTMYLAHPASFKVCTLYSAPCTLTPCTLYTLHPTEHKLYLSHSPSLILYTPYPAPMCILKYDCLPPSTIPFQILKFHPITVLKIRPTSAKSSSPPCPQILFTLEISD